ncbi:MAG: hypothetical protein ACJAU0_001816 [Flavobacteriales bacterium]|jgi:hypothetical protein
MRCWNLTYNDPDRWAEVHAISGKPLSFIAGIKAGGTGSPRGVLLHLPTELNSMLTETSNADYCNIQRTSDGGILFFKVRLELYGIPLNRSDFRFVRSELQADGSGVFTLQFNEGRYISFRSTFSNRSSWNGFLEKTFPIKRT